MKLPLRKSIVWTAGLLIAGLLLVFSYQLTMYGGIVSRRFSTSEVLAVEAFVPWNMFNVHGDHPRLLISKGHRFERLSGTFPYFLDVPQIDSIIFMEGNYQGEDAFVLLNLDTGKFLEAPVGREIIGTLGLGRTDKYAMRVRSIRGLIVELEDGFVTSTEHDFTMLYTIDFGAKTVRKRKVRVVQEPAVKSTP